MKVTRRQTLLALALLAPGSLGLSAQSAHHGHTASPHASGTDSATDPAWLEQLSKWRAQREQELSAPDGWLTLVGLEWLKPGPNSFGAAADNPIRIRAKAPDHLGSLDVSGATVKLVAPNDGFPAEFQLDGKPAREAALTTDGAKPSTMTWHGVTMVVLTRGDRFALRIKDADSPTRTGFRGLKWYAPNPSLRVTANWIPYSPPHVEEIPTLIGTTLHMPAPGIAEFTLHGKPMKLEPVIEGNEQDKLFFILRDTTSMITTYEAARFLHTGLPSNGVGKPGTLTLDFNELYNPPCAYTPYATCPLPPPQNRLNIPIEAGEQRYSH